MQMLSHFATKYGQNLIKILSFKIDSFTEQIDTGCEQNLCA